MVVHTIGGLPVATKYHDKKGDTGMQRRALIASAGAVALAGRAGAVEKPSWMSPQLPDGTREEAVLEALPGKHKLIRLTSRPPNYEAPIEAFRTPTTSNELFFVRYHLADIPDMKALGTWSLSVGGEAAERQVTLSLNDLQKNFPQVEIAAVCQCSGNRRGLSSPHVAGVEWGYGAMGCATWRGARLKDVLASPQSVLRRHERGRGL
jgi:sulfite dehydrogenase